MKSFTNAAARLAPTLRPRLLCGGSASFDEADDGYTQRPRLRRVLRSSEAESDRVPAAASGIQEAVTTAWHHPRLALLEGCPPGATSFSTWVTANPRLSQGKRCRCHQPALRVLRIPVW